MDPLLKRSVAADRRRTSPGECPDADLLAAFVDGTLAAAERRAIEAHAADCQRCSDILALSAAAEDPALSATITHVVAVDRWRRAYWTVPLATAATVAALWVVTSHEAVAPTEPRISASKSAQQGEPAPPAPRPSAPSPGAIAHDAGAPAPAVPRRDERAPSRFPATPQATKDQSQEQQAAPATAPLQAPPELSVRAPAAQQADAAESPARSVRPQAAARGSVRVVSPDMASEWRTRGLVIERSIDGGVTWTQEYSAPRGLTTGLAVSADVAWFGGVQGLVLRRTASGWTVVTVPAADPVTTIRATDANSAVVTLAGGLTLRTTDGGVSWR